MKLSILIILVIAFLFFPYCKFYNIHAQHGNQGMTFDISVENHDIVIKQMNYHNLKDCGINEKNQLE